VRAGARVRAGDPIGVVRGRHVGCIAPCLHWGARRGDHYLNPLDLLRPLGPVVLLPDRAEQVQARG
jgi:murein DD-endopeptidase MepM/ murein hydrolase activator NlpD